MPDRESRATDGRSTNNDQVVKDILAHVREQSGTDFTQYKQATVLRRIAKRQQEHQLATLDQYLRFLKDNAAEAAALLQELLIGITDFFRDSAVFRVLAQKGLPHLLTTRPPKVPLRVWVPGCSTGEEAYSIAMVLREYLAAREEETKVHMFATDLDSEAVETARSGVYPPGIEKTVSPERLAKFFTRIDTGYRVKKDVRELVIFATHDLLTNPPFTKIDLISCRNVQIYLDAQAQRQLLLLFHYALNPNGLLLLGSAETIGEVEHLFTPLDRKTKLFVRKETKKPVRFPDWLAVRPTTVPPRIVTTEQQALPRMDLIDPTLMEGQGTASVLVDDNGEIVQIHGKTGMFLELAPGPPSHHLLVVAREEFRSHLAAALQVVIRGSPSTIHRRIPLQQNDGAMHVDLTVRRLTEPERLRGLILVRFETSFSPKPPARRTKGGKPIQAKKRDAALIQELEQSKGRMQRILEEYQASNEELQATNEELQSSNQELESAKEELQSLNEELTVVNTELEGKVQALKESEERFRFLVEGVKDYAIFMLDPEGRVASWNAGAERIKGYRAEEIIGQHFSRFYPPEAVDRRSPALALERAATEGRFEENGWRVRKDGTRFWANVIIVPLRDPHGQLRGFAKVTRDLTESRKVSEALGESEERFRLMVEGVKDYAIFMLDPQGYVATWNAGAEHIKGYRAEEIIGQHFSRFYPTEAVQRGRPQDVLDLARSLGRYEEEGWRLRKDGSHFWASIMLTALYDDLGKVRGFAKITRDLTDRRQVEEALRYSEERFRQLVEDVTDYAIIMLDPDGRVTTWNSGARRIMGYRPQEIIGQHFSRFYPEEAQDRNWPATELEQAARDGRVEDEGWRVRKDGSRYWANVIITALRGPDGRLRGFSKIARDLTEQRQMREQLRILAARMESTREQEATRIAHQIHDELGQAMTGLKLDIELAKRQYAADDPVLAGRFDAIIESVRAIMTTIRNIATELRPVVLDQLGLPAAIEWLAKEFESRSRTRFQIDFPMRSVRMSEERKTAAFRILREVLINIVRHADAANVRITAQVQEGRVIFEVADDGRGITEAEITDYKSFGLMAMRHRASMVGGEVHVRPREGGGTIVTVTMPLEPAQE